MTRATPRYKVQLKTSPLRDEWTDVQMGTGRRFRFVDEEDAKLAIRALLRSQPHATYRVVGI